MSLKCVSIPDLMGYGVHVNMEKAVFSVSFTDLHIKIKSG